jgi:hypothetical protein
MKKSLIQTSLISLGVFVASGCVITDYTGLPFHKTSGEAKLLGTEFAFSGFGDDLDGTYSYTAKYDHTAGFGPVTLNAYRNPVVSSFSRDYVVNRDGDDIQGRSGDLGGKFLSQFKAVDNDPTTCGFFDNVTFDKSDQGPQLAVCMDVNEEVDRDLDLQAPVASLDELFGAIWSATLRGNISLEITALRINGNVFEIGDAFSLFGHAGPMRPGNWIIDANQPATAALIGTLLDNTEHNKPVTLGLVFDGGLTFNVPNGTQFAFNHDGLWGILEN